MNISKTIASLAQLNPRVSSLIDQDLAPPLRELEQLLRVPIGPFPVNIICSDLFASGGKRLRSLATLTVARAAGVSPDIAIPLASAVELTHAATLLHDDVIDESDTRRGQATARCRFSNTLSVLSGDFLLLRALKEISKLQIPALENAHLQTLDQLLSAEVMQHTAKQSGDLSVQGYLDIAQGKTGSLFAFACSAPLLCASDQSAYADLRRFGNLFGISFQILDDVRDLAACDHSKSVELDISAGLLTLPLRLAASESPGLGQRLLSLRNRSPEPSEIQLLIADVLATSAVAAALSLGAERLEDATSLLQALPFSHHLEALRTACAVLQTERTHLEHHLQGDMSC